ncbi:MAG: hypothetical protein WCG45_00790 [bacterium]
MTTKDMPPKNNPTDKPVETFSAENEEQTKEVTKKKALEALKNKKVAIVNIEDLSEKEARDAADKYMTEDKESLKGFKGFFKKIWKHTYVDEFYRQREVGRIKNEIKETGNIYTRESDKTAHENAMHAVTDRFISDYDGVVEKEIGEQKKVLDDKDPNSLETKKNIKKLIYGYADGSIDELSFTNIKDRIIKSIKNQDLIKGTENYTDNLLEIAKDAKIAIEHGAKLEELDLDTNIILGRAKSSIKTEANFSYVDKAIDSMKKTYLGRFVSPPMVATALGIAYSIAITASKRLASSRAAQIMTLGGAAIAAGGFAFVNESQRVANERRQHSRDITKGQVFEEGDKRREQMKKYEYSMEKSTDLENDLRDLLYTKNQEGKDEIKNIDETKLEEIIANLSEIEARRSLSNKKQIDLISYSNIANVEREKADLFILVNKSKAELKKKFGTGPLQGLQGKTIDEYLEEVTASQEKVLLGGEKGIDAQDKDFRKYKYTRAGKKAAMTVVGGFLIGGAIQEGIGLASSHVQSAIEGLTGHHGNATIQTPLEYLRGVISGHPSHLGMENAHDQLIGNAHIKLPEGVNIIKNPDGTFNVMRGTDVLSNNITLNTNPAGGLDAASISKLGESGIMVNTHIDVIDSTKEVTENTKDWIANHPKETIPVARDGWYGNDTPNYIDPDTGKTMGSDLNELKTMWGGLDGSGVNTNGDYVLNISHMSPDGSFQDGLSVDAQKAMENGNLMAIISLSGDTQGHCIPVPIGADGNIIFDHNNPLMQELFKPDANGHPVYHGKFLEIVEKMGTDANGVEHVRPLGTLVGEGLSGIKDNIDTHTIIETNELGVPLPTQPPYFVPILSRRPLETGKYTKQDKTPTKPGEKPKDIMPGKPGEKPNETISDVIPPIVPIVPLEDKTIEKKPTQEKKEVSQEEYDAMKDDMIMLNRKRQLQDGIATIREGDFKSEYGKKRYRDLEHIADGIPATFNHEELLVIGDEIENILRNSKVVRVEKETDEQKKQKSDVQSDLEMLNKKIQSSEGIATMTEADFKSEYGKKRYNELNHIGEGIPVTFNKEELEKIATEMEKTLVGSRKIEDLKRTTDAVVETTTPAPAPAPVETPAEVPIESPKKPEATKTPTATSEGMTQNTASKENATAEQHQASGESLRPSGEKVSSIEKKFTAEDLSKIGTKFESKDFLFEVADTPKRKYFGLGAPIIKVNVIDKTGKRKPFVINYDKKKLEELLKSDLENGGIKITKAGN